MRAQAERGEVDPGSDELVSFAVIVHAEDEVELRRDLLEAVFSAFPTGAGISAGHGELPDELGSWEAWIEPQGDGERGPPQPSRLNGGPRGASPPPLGSCPTPPLR